MFLRAHCTCLRRTSYLESGCIDGIGVVVVVVIVSDFLLTTFLLSASLANRSHCLPVIAITANTIKIRSRVGQISYSHNIGLISNFVLQNLVAPPYSVFSVSSLYCDSTSDRCPPLTGGVLAKITVQVAMTGFQLGRCMCERSGAWATSLKLSSPSHYQYLSQHSGRRAGGDRSFYEAILTLHWCPDDRLSEGYSVSVPCISFLTLCTRR
uniref:Uncharacterized protein n=1 Tax=Hyaloperonospora arabidopsidis (strain Emoy2) TaxID=559515 RepID=M4C3F3_HYAAE